MKISLKDMKKICYIIALFGLMSCQNNNAPKLNLEREHIFKDQYGTSLYSKEFTYKGHNYIWFNSSTGYDGASGFVHNPDCQCHKKESN